MTTGAATGSAKPILVQVHLVLKAVVWAAQEQIILWGISLACGASCGGFVWGGSLACGGWGALALACGASFSRAPGFAPSGVGPSGAM